MYDRKLLIAYPGAQWSLLDINDFSTLNWLDINTDPQPSLEDLEMRFNQKAGEHAMMLLRQKRNALLQETDRYGLADYPFVDDVQKNAWLEYRNALRNITKTAVPMLTSTFELDESSVSWPVKP